MNVGKKYVLKKVWKPLYIKKCGNDLVINLGYDRIRKEFLFTILIDSPANDYWEIYKRIIIN
jgi:hypothetical protein